MCPKKLFFLGKILAGWVSKTTTTHHIKDENMCLSSFFQNLVYRACSTVLEPLT